MNAATVMNAAQAGKHYTVREYGSFLRDRPREGYLSLPPHTFDALETFILTKCTEDSGMSDVMGLSVRRGVGKVITAKNHVGILVMTDGTVIEILPKIDPPTTLPNGADATLAARRLLLRMLRTLREGPYKHLQTAHMDVAKMSILEVFIRAFLDEVFLLVKRGLRGGYKTVEENAAVFKGKLRFSEHIKHNAAHRERAYVAYDVFSPNRPENRLVKATLLLLLRCTASEKNRRDIRRLLDSFEAVEASVNHGEDFARCVSDRQTRDYATALDMCRVFLSGKSYTSFAGSRVALALLYPMEILFESYVAVCLRRALAGQGYRISVQDTAHSLFDSPRRFSLRPDIVLSRESDGAVFVMDTKWKRLSDDPRASYGISQADMYQMYAYHKKYDARHVTLLYPKTADTPAEEPTYTAHEPDGTLVTVRVRFVDLFAELALPETWRETVEL